MEELLPFEKIKRKVLIKKESGSDPAFGCVPKNRLLETSLKYGIINLNKPSGPTSHQITDYVKKIFGSSKAGHSGTLDPKVTGVLPIALDNATRIVQVLLNAGKEYVALMKIHDDVPEDKVRKEFKKLVGTITQLPPVRSAVKRQHRQRNIYYCSILDINERLVLFRVGCQAGTYIRKLIHDFGLQLNSRAHMVQLVRTKAGPFKDIDWVSLQDVRDAFEFYKEGKKDALKKIIRPVEDAVSHLPKVWIFDSAINTVCHGSSLGVQGIAKLNDNIQPNELVAIMSLKDELVAMAHAAVSSDEMVSSDIGLATTVFKVFMERNTYASKKVEGKE
tara:strand:- start:30135 stop:31133 length:999 start_codon:yes stop_codon:yes gene_type:complete